MGYGGQGAVSESKRTIGWVLVAGMAKLGFALLAVATPLLGVWIGSSLARMFDGPVWLPILCGALCFPVLPLLWEALGRWRHRNRTRPPFLTVFDRLVLRTLSINVLFVGGLLALYPSTVFTALSERGDWMLEGREGAWAEQARDVLHATADRMEWLHQLTHPNEYEELIDPTSTGEQTEVDSDSWGDFSWQPSRGGVSRPEDIYSEDAWPFSPKLHPLVLEIPADVQGTPQTVGAFFAEREADPLQRLKAVHDYVANRTAYDVPALRSRQFPPQDAQTVLDTKMAVCAGYAQLVKAIGDAAGLEVVVVVGKTRSTDGLGHAWNAAKVDGKWYLLDATWDAGTVGGDTFNKSFGTRYLMTPPAVFLADHFPDDEKWQFVDEPLSMGDFLRQPNLEPSFFAYGFRLLSPRRPTVTVSGRSISVTLENPNGFDVSAQSYVGESWEGESSRCEVERNEVVVCPLAARGPNLVVLFGPDRKNMAQVLVTRD